ncbi:CRACD-like protein isoform X2 [Amia ocellicauda]|uniref:CRACD-like protein isoform X2 n=1 Tax=Amia ocellicauda TaxID=2972642 RepID=UPI003463C536
MTRELQEDSWAGSACHCSNHRVVAAELMEPKMEEAEGGSEDITGKKKSRFKSFKIRLFGKRKRKEGGTSASKSSLKQSQSSSDVTAPESLRANYDSEEEFGYPQGVLASRALSHDSIFIAESSQTSPGPARVLSQENVHGRIKALQLKLQQNIRLGPPPLVIPSKRSEDAGASSEDDGLPRSPPEISPLHDSLFTDTYRHHSSLSLAGTGSEEEEQDSSQPPSRPLSPVYRPSPKSASPLSPSADFSSPPQLTTCLDNSAARHRLSVKPRKQRASARGRRPTPSTRRPRSESLNDLDFTLLENEEEEEQEVPQEIIRCYSYSSQVSVSGPESAQVTKSSGALVHASETQNWNKPSTEPNDVSVPSSPPPSDSCTAGLLSGQPAAETQNSTAVQETNPVSVLGEVLGKHDPATVKPSSTQKMQSNDLLREIIHSGPRSHKENTPTQNFQTSDNTAAKEPVAKSEVSEANSSNSSLAKSSLNLSHGAQSEPCSKEQPSSAPRLVKTLPSVDRVRTARDSSLTKSSVAIQGVAQDSISPDLAQVTASTPAEEEAVPAAKVNLRHNPSFKKTNGGSFRFSISSAWDRPRASSFVAAEPTEVKTEEGVLPKTSSYPKLSPVARTEETKPELQRTLVANQQERRNTLRKQDETPSKAAKELCEKLAPATRLGDPTGCEPVGLEDDVGERSPFGVKLRSTSLSLRYRMGSHPDLKVKRHSAEVCPAAPNSQDLILLPRAGKSDQDKNCESPGGSLKDECNVKAKSTEQLNIKPPLPRKPAVQNTSPPTSSTTAKSQPKNPERLSFHKLGDFDLQIDQPVNPEIGILTKSVADAGKESDSSGGPAWITMARQRQRGFQQHYNNKEDTDPVPEGQTDRLNHGEHKPEPGRAVCEVRVSVESPTLRRAAPDSRLEVKLERWQAARTTPAEAAPCPAEKEDKLQSGKDSPLSVSPSAAVLGKPSWMELAKKKSQAWSDKTMD